MKLVIDTSALTPFLKKDTLLLRTVAQVEYTNIIIPLAVDAEIRYGFANGNREADNLTNYQQFSQQFNLEVMCPNHDCAQSYAELAAWCRRKGVALSQNDLWVAACCLQVDGKLLTLDQDFARLPQLRLVDLAQ